MMKSSNGTKKGMKAPIGEIDESLRDNGDDGDGGGLSGWVV